MAKHAPQDTLTDFFQESLTNLDEAELGSAPNASRRKVYERDAYMLEVAQRLKEERERDKAFYYWCADRFYAPVRHMDTDAKCVFWQKHAPNKYPTIARYARAIRAWQHSGVEYPYSIPVPYLLLSQGLLRPDKADFVKFLEEKRSREEIDDWIALRKNGGVEPEYYGWKYLKKFLPDDAVAAIVDRAKRYGVESLLEWSGAGEDFCDIEE